MLRRDVFRVGLNGETAIPRAEIDNPPSERSRAGLEAMLFAFRTSTIFGGGSYQRSWILEMAYLVKQFPMEEETQ
jgi:hypothetical protein